MSVPELATPADAGDIGALLDQSFGSDRLKKTSYRFREGVEPLHELCFVLREAGILRASIGFWPMLIRPEKGAAVPALLLGPLAVDPRLRGQGLGLRLMRRGLEEAAAQGHRIVVLVGDLGYYERFGFRRAAPGQFVFPGPVDEHRILVQELVPGALQDVAGHLVKAAPARQRVRRRA
jgi:predicted N-acetyltransferase YhbS